MGALFTKRERRVLNEAIRNLRRHEADDIEMTEQLRRVDKRGLADELATGMISAHTKTLQKWVEYRKFKPALAAFIYDHLDSPPQGVEWEK